MYHCTAGFVSEGVCDQRPGVASGGGGVGNVGGGGGDQRTTGPPKTYLFVVTEATVCDANRVHTVNHCIALVHTRQNTAGR
jgi:hypothetical protein